MNIKEVTKALYDLGVTLSERTIRNYESWGLIPQSTKTWLGRGKGSDVQYSNDTPNEAYAAFNMLRHRRVSIEEVKFSRNAGLRLIKHDYLLNVVLEKETVKEDDFYDFLKKLKEKVFFDIPSYEMLGSFLDVAAWTFFYTEADDISHGKINLGAVPVDIKVFSLIYNKLGKDFQYAIPPYPET